MFKTLATLIILLLAIVALADNDHLSQPMPRLFGSVLSGVQTGVMGVGTSNSQAQAQSGIETTAQLHKTPQSITTLSTTQGFSMGASQASPQALAAYSAQSSGFSGGVMGYLPALPAGSPR
jgi:hypothetical protein